MLTKRNIASTDVHSFGWAAILCKGWGARPILDWGCYLGSVGPLNTIEGGRRDEMAGRLAGLSK